MNPKPDHDTELLVARDASYYRAPDALRARIRRSVGAETRAPRSSWWHWSGMALACAVVGVLSWNAALWRAANLGDDAIAREVANAHVRSLQVEGRLSDVASSDRHTVKPWFQGKVDFAPVVLEMPASDFSLQGGRLDYMNGRAVAAITYRFRLHAVNLFEWPAAGEAPPQLTARDGYSIVRWRRDGLQYWLVSDAAGADLLKFAEQLARS